MRAAVVPATIAWLVGVLSLPLAALLVDIFAAQARGEPWWHAAPLARKVSEDLGYVPIMLVAVAVVVFPTCLLVVVPLLKLLPRTSPLWQPGRAALTGAIVGPMAMYLWSAGSELQFFVPNLLDSSQQGAAAAAALVGMTFGFQYAKSVRAART